MKQTLLLIAFSLFITVGAWAQSPVGQWKTIDDETGKERSIVEIYEKNGKLYGKIVKLLNRGADEDPDPVCDKCPNKDDRKDQKVIGMEILREMAKDGDEWEDGTILDPEKGKVYDCKLWIDPANKDILKLRGYVAFFFRTQDWHRVK
ncbi:MAG: DUF2147 domain-containing protein [Flammeovirgaceae bacterium]